jgi:hypothetical protein
MIVAISNKQQNCRAMQWLAAAQSQSDRRPNPVLCLEREKEEGGIKTFLYSVFCLGSWGLSLAPIIIIMCVYLGLSVEKASNQSMFFLTLGIIPTSKYSCGRNNQRVYHHPSARKNPTRHSHERSAHREMGMMEGDRMTWNGMNGVLVENALLIDRWPPSDPTQHHAQFLSP